jgi:hypothetical protein
MFPNSVKLVSGQITERLICGQMVGGRDRDRTGAPLLAKQASHNVNSGLS